MARTYSNFLLFEDVLDNLPEDSSPILLQAVNFLLNPSTVIVEEDCGTLLGKVVQTNFELEGLTYLATGDKLSHSSIQSLLADGKYKIRIRDLHSCNSHLKGGVCQKCYEATLLGETAPLIGTALSIPTSLIYQSDLLIGNNYTSKFPVSQTEDDWYDLKVIHNGEIIDPSLYTIGFDFIQFPSILATNDTYVVHFLQENTEPFQGYVAKTYSGGILGMEPLPTLDTMLRESLYEAMFPDNFFSLMMEELKTLKTIPSTYSDYVERIHDKLERVLYVLYLYALYKNLEY